MVMEIPTPQCVGREFVRQYYTLLNKAPLHLHRFYNHDSSFLHGGLDRPGQETRPVVGQQDIHERIMQLNFRDCHAKIRQVDSLETLSDGVVVQVSGELSNGGQPMRRFMQTFVLVPQSPKKYYVRNDIFRYQDEIFSEDDAALTDIDVEEAVTKKQGSPTQEDDGYHEAEIVRNGMYGSEPAPSTVEQEWEEEELEEADDDEDEEIAPTEETPSSSLVTSLLLQPQHSSPTPPTVEHSMEPKTYANMVSKNTPGLPPTSPIVSQPVVVKEQPPTQPPQPRRPSSPEDGDRGMRRGLGGTFPHYNDNQQLFVGNLTHSITEEDLKAHFTKFGRVLDMRINTKQTQKLGGGKVPNFGFIVFEDDDSVQRVLQARPIFFNDHRLNVEEKKRPKDNHNRMLPARPSPRMGPGGARGRSMGGGPQGRGGMRGGFVPRR